MEDYRKNSDQLAEVKKVALECCAHQACSWVQRTAGVAIALPVLCLLLPSDALTISAGLVGSASLFGALVSYANYRGLKRRLDAFLQDKPQQPERPENAGQRILYPNNRPK